MLDAGAIEGLLERLGVLVHALLQHQADEQALVVRAVLLEVGLTDLGVAGREVDGLAAQALRVGDGVILRPPLAAVRAPHVLDIAAAGLHAQTHGLVSELVHGGVEAAEGHHGVVDIGVRGGEVHRGLAAHRDAPDGGLGGRVELLLDDGGELLGEERLPLVVAERRVRLLPVGVERRVGARRVHHVHVLVSETVGDLRLVSPPGAGDRRPDPVEHVEDRRGALTTRRDDLDGDLALHGLRGDGPVLVGPRVARLVLPVPLDAAELGLRDRGVDRGRRPHLLGRSRVERDVGRADRADESGGGAERHGADGVDDRLEIVLAERGGIDTRGLGESGRGRPDGQRDGECAGCDSGDATESGRHVAPKSDEKCLRNLNPD